MRRPPGLTPTAPAPAEPPPAAAAPANYLDLYGLSKPPFGEPSEGASYILFGSHRQAFELLIDHMVNGSGLVVLHGEDGAGKTEMLRVAGDVAGESGVRTIRVARSSNRRMDATQLVSALRSGSDPDLPVADTVQTILGPPHKALLVDDLDLLPPDCVHLLARLLRPSSEPGGVAIVATSTADISADPARPELMELARMARTSVRLPRIGPAEARQYIERSLWIAGGTTRPLMTPDALKLVVARSGGLPGSINRQMEAAFTAGFARGDARITGKTITATVGPTRQQPADTAPKPIGAAARFIPGLAMGLLAVGTAAFLYKGLHHREQPPAAAAAPTLLPALPPPPAAAPQPTPAPPPPPTKPVETLSPDLMAALMQLAEQSLSVGDIAGARLLFQLLAGAGNAQAAIAMGMTYDPDSPATGSAHAEKPDPVLAAEWYRQAAALGDPRAGDQLKRLNRRSSDTKR